MIGMPGKVFSTIMIRRHFHTLDALRFFAFLKVFLLHIPFVSFPVYNFIKAGGGIGVSFFFVLSGFLITFIILEEKKLTGKLSLKNFFIRRSLRIWPLFYAMILFAFLTPFILSTLGVSSSNVGYEPNWILSCLFLENYQMMFQHALPNVSPLGVMWSLCVEEHFYLVWGLLLYLINSKHLPIAILCSFVIANLFRWYYFSVGLDYLDLFSNLDFFAFGAIPAYFLSLHEQKFQTYFRRISSLKKGGIIALTIASVFVIPNLPYTTTHLWSPTILGILFSLSLCILVSRIPSSESLQENVFNLLGRYTYGMYLFHGIIINLLIQIYKRSGISVENAGFAVLFFGGTLLATIVTSIISYHLFEKPFLRLKRFF